MYVCCVILSDNRKNDCMRFMKYACILEDELYQYKKLDLIVLKFYDE